MSNIEQKHLELINQFNNIIDLIKGADTEEQIKMLKELPKLDADNMMNEFEELEEELKEEYKEEFEEEQEEYISSVISNAGFDKEIFDEDNFEFEEWIVDIKEKFDKLKEENFNQFSKHLHSLETVRKEDLKAMNEILKEKAEKAEKDRLEKIKLRNDLEIANMLLIDDVISENIDNSIGEGENQITIHTGEGFFKDKKIDYIKEYIIPHLLKNNSNEDERYSAFKNGYYYYKGHYEEQYEVVYNGDDTLCFNRVESSEEEEESEE